MNDNDKYTQCNKCKSIIYSPTRSGFKCECGGKFKRITIKSLNLKATKLRNEISNLSFQIGDKTDELMNIRTAITIIDRQRGRPDEGIEINGSGPSLSNDRRWMNITLWSDGPKKPRTERVI